MWVRLLSVGSSASTSWPVFQYWTHVLNFPLSPGGPTQHHGFQYPLHAKRLQLCPPPDSTTANATVGLDVTRASQTCPSPTPAYTTVVSLQVRKHSSPSAPTTSVRRSPSPAPKSTSATFSALPPTPQPPSKPPSLKWWWLVPSLFVPPAARPSHTDRDQGQVPPPSNLPVLQEGGTPSEAQ